MTIIEWFIYASCVLDLCFCSNLLQCEFATKNKYLGYFSVSPGSFTSGRYFKSVKSNNSEDCKNLCRINQKCLSVAYNMTKDCSFYNTTLLTVQFDNGYDNVVYYWYRCVWKAWSKEPRDGRCRGMFIGHVNFAVSVNFDYMKLGVLNGVYETDCLDRCSDNPICQIVNYDVTGRQCRLYEGWPREYVTMNDMKGVNMHQWTCTPDFVDSILRYQHTKKRNLVKCTGTWNITDRSMKIANGSVTGAYFYTQSFTSCLEECNANLICDEVLFNVTYSLCILPRKSYAANSQYVTDHYFIKFQWICSKNDSLRPKKTEKEQSYEAMGMQCSKLVNNSDVYISRDNCGVPSTTFSKCNDSSIRGEWTTTDSCLIGQVFWAFKTENSTRNILGRHERITKIFTGLTSYWLIHARDSIFRADDYLTCRKFDSSKTDELMDERLIKSRSEWYALPTVNIRNISVLPASLIIVDSSEIPFFSCRTLMACVSILRNLQIRYFKGIGPIPGLNDNPYNFMLNENGTVFAIRGWNAKCAAFPDYPESLCFAFIGSFHDSYPTVEFIESLKRFINFAVTKGHVVRDYDLLLYSDVTNVYSHRNLSLIMKNWHRYRNFTTKSCSNIKLTTGIVNVVVIVLASLAVLLTYIRFFRARKCSKCSFLHDVLFEMIHPMNTLSSSHQQRSHNTKYYIITEKPDFLYPGNSSKLIKIVKLWFTNEYIESYVSKHLFSNLTNYINRFSKKKIEIHEGYVIGEDVLLNPMRVILCFSEANSFADFTNVIESRLCVCKRFSIYFQSFPSLASFT